MKKSVNLFISIFMTCLLLFGLSTTSFAVEYSGDEATEIIPVLHVNLDTQEETLFNFTYNPSDNSNTLSSYGSFIDGPSENSIIGSDDRLPVTNTTTGPYYGIAYIKTQFNDGSYIPGTGFMISKNVVLTAGHCVYGDGRLEITVYPGRNGNSYTLSSTVKEIYFFGYDGSNTDLDYSILVLRDNLGSTCGWLGIQAASDSTLKNLKITTSGYPSDKASGDNRTMWTSTGTILSVTEKRFKHNADTYSGQSGSPIYYYNGSYGYQAVGIHTQGGNYARRITQSLFDFLRLNDMIEI